MRKWTFIFPAVTSIINFCLLMPLLYREDFYFVDWFHSSAHHGDRCTTGCEAHMDFADEAACLKADNIRNEGKFLPFFTDHRRC
jgi:hypothetical protein